MKRLFLSLAGAGLALLATVAGAAAVEPTPAPTTPAPVTMPARGNDTIADLLGLTSAQVMDLRHDGLSLAQIAERQKLDPQKLVDALVARWGERIDARLAYGALTADQAAALKADRAVRAKAMVNQTALGGMRGAAVGGGPSGAMRGMRAGRWAGTTDNAAGQVGRGRGGFMRDGAGTGACAACSTASPTPTP